MTVIADTHSYIYDTRQSSTIQIAPTKTLLAKNTIKIQGAIFWNILRPTIKNSPSLYNLIGPVLYCAVCFVLSCLCMFVIAMPYSVCSVLSVQRGHCTYTHSVLQ